MPAKGVTKKILVSDDELKRMIESGTRMNQIAKVAGVCRHTVGKALDRLGIQRPPQHSCPGSINPMWTGGRITDKSGYILVHRPDHPFASKKGKGRAGYVREHRLVMEAVIGRYLTSEEVVHHKDGNKQNNTPSNLELFMKNADHLAYELKGRVPKWTEAGMDRILAGGKKNKGKTASAETRLKLSIAQLRRYGKA